MSRIYKVKTPGGDRLVKSNTKGQAIKHCVEGDYDAEPVGSAEMYDLIQAGAEVEDIVEKKVEAGDTPKPIASTPSAPATPPAQSTPAPTASGKTPAPVAAVTPPVNAVNPVLAEQQTINPKAAEAAGAPPPIAPNAGGPVDWQAREESGQ